ncbi:MAG TPA: class I SAM-dependent methyltransferase, partial [Polyangiaceae bacterium]|nr:class I SAM-dependent methyltransferase [Polyangiaceae bacterium]
KDHALGLAIKRTLSRYRGASLGDRRYVAGKLRHDPVLSGIADLGLELGDTVDAGAGPGQLSLCLRELGLVRTLVGFDLDPRKVTLAEQAAGGDASFTVADLADAELPEADTVLLVDVLHYLPLGEQDALLERAARSLRPGGRLLLRDADKRPGISSLLTRGLEYLAAATGFHRSRSRLCFRPMAEVIARLEALGLHCVAQAAAQGTPFANVLVIATRMHPPQA